MTPRLSIVANESLEAAHAKRDLEQVRSALGAVPDESALAASYRVVGALEDAQLELDRLRARIAKERDARAFAERALHRAEARTQRAESRLQVVTRKVAS